MHILTRKRALGVLSTFAVLAVAGVAFAYFTSTGSGEGAATTGSSTANIVVKSTTSGELYPLTSKPSANTTITIENKGTGVEYVKEVTETEITTSKVGCEGTWFKFETSPISINEEIAPGATIEKKNVATVWLENKAADQSACKGATVTVHYTSN